MDGDAALDAAADMLPAQAPAALVLARFIIVLGMALSLQLTGYPVLNGPKYRRTHGQHEGSHGNTTEKSRNTFCLQYGTCNVQDGSGGAVGFDSRVDDIQWTGKNATGNS